MNGTRALRSAAAVGLFLVSIVAATPARVVYVDDDATGANDGSSWTDAFCYLQDALMIAKEGDKIRIAQGTYKPDEGAAVTPGDRESTFAMVSGAVLRGGYGGVTADTPDARDIGLYQTILTGDLNGDDAEIQNHALVLPAHAENSFHVLSFHNANASTVLDGCTVTGATNRGMIATSSNPTIVDCVFLRNATDYHGGAICGVGGHLTIKRCRFISNLAGKSGGAVYVSLGGTAALADCLFQGNRTGRWGGAVRSHGDFLTLLNCIFSCNEGFNGGAVVYDGQDGHVDIRRCTFSDNGAFGWEIRGQPYAGGGALHIYTSGSLYDVEVTDCLFERNWTADGGGAIHLEVPGRLHDCRFVGNQAQYGGAVFGLADGHITHSIFAGNRASLSGGAVYHASLGNTLAHCTFVGNTAPEGRALTCNRILFGGDVDAPLSGTELSHCILWDGPGEIARWPDNARTVTVTYSDIFGGWPGEGNVDVDPRFCQPGDWDPNDTPLDPNDDFWVDGDVHLKSRAGRWDPVSESWVKDDEDSPCIDAGDPSGPIGDELSPNGGIANLGAYGGTTEASKSYFGEPVCETRMAGDVNGDCKVDFEDLLIVLSQWTAGMPPAVGGATVSIVEPIDRMLLHARQDEPLLIRAVVRDPGFLAVEMRFTIRHDSETFSYQGTYAASQEDGFWSLQWYWRGSEYALPEGVFVIWAEAFDETGTSAISQEVTVTIEERDRSPRRGRAEAQAPAPPVRPPN
jgi:predicted outer membrane repeat protein